MNLITSTGTVHAAKTVKIAGQNVQIPACQSGRMRRSHGHSLHFAYPTDKPVTCGRCA